MQPQYPAKFRENQPRAFFAQWKRASVMRTPNIYEKKQTQGNLVQTTLSRAFLDPINNQL